MKTIGKLSKLDLVRGPPKKNFEKDDVCEACVKGKHVKSSFHSIDKFQLKGPLNYFTWIFLV